MAKDVNGGSVATDEEEFTEAAVDMATAPFERTVLASKSDYLDQLSKEIQAKLDAAPQNEGGMLSNVFGGGAGTDLAQAEIQRLNREKMNADQVLADVTRSMQKLEMRFRAASEKLEPALTTGVDDHIRAKKAILNLGMKVDPYGSKCAILLGHMYTRCPKFALAHNALKVIANRGTTEQVTIPAALPDIEQEVLGTWHLQAEIDNLIEAATHQDSNAIDKLLAYMNQDSLPQQAHSHLTHVVVTKATHCELVDQAAKEMTGFKTAICAHFPKAHTSSKNAHSYQALSMMLSNSNYQKPGGEKHDDPLQAETAETPKHSRPQRDSMRHILEILDQTILGIYAADEFAHMLPPVTRTMMTIMRRALEACQRQKYVLYGHLAFNDPEPHWFLRRRAASKICDLARTGNKSALALMRDLLHDENEHWMVKQAVVAEVLGVVTAYKEEDKDTHPLIEELADLAFTLPVDDRVEKKTTRDLQLKNKGTRILHEKAEEAICRDLPTFSLERLNMALGIIKTRCTSCPGRELPARTAVLDRIHKAVPSITSKAESTKLTMKQMREQQKEMDGSAGPR